MYTVYMCIIHVSIIHTYVCRILLYTFGSIFIFIFIHKLYVSPDYQCWTSSEPMFAAVSTGLAVVWRSVAPHLPPLGTDRMPAQVETALYVVRDRELRDCFICSHTMLRSNVDAA